MKFSYIRNNIKTDAAPPSVMLYRKLGTWFTWIVLNIFPGVSANSITILMLVLNIMSSCFLYYSVVKGDLLYLGAFFVLFNISIVLDCVDGNIARIKNQRSVPGVFLDRLVHNVSYPLLFLAVGYGMYAIHEQLWVLSVFIVAGILVELSPIDIAIKDTQNLFLRQLVFQRTQAYELTLHRVGLTSEKSVSVSKEKQAGRVLGLIRRLRCLVTLVPLWNQIAIVVAIDVIFQFSGYTAISLVFAVLFIVKQTAGSIVRVRRSMREIKGFQDITKRQGERCETI